MDNLPDYPFSGEEMNRVIKGFITKDSGERENFETGARRDNRTGKGRFDLIPALPLERLAQLYERGAIKYDAWNWSKGFPFSRCLDSLLRHANQYKNGDRDEDHLAGVVFNAFCIMHFEEMISKGVLPKELDDLPKFSTEVVKAA